MSNRFKKINETYIEKDYYYDEIKSKIIILIIWSALLPINMYLYDTGVYGEFDLSAKFLFTQFLKDTIKYDIAFSIIIVGSIIVFLKKLIRDKNNYIRVTRRATIVNVAILLMFSIIPIIVYLLAPMYSSICLLICIPGVNLAIISELTMQFVKKEKIE